MVLKFYRKPGLTENQEKDVFLNLKTTFPDLNLVSIETEICFYVSLRQDSPELTCEQLTRLRWILSVAFQEEALSRESFLTIHSREKTLLAEIGPRLNFSTAFSTNAVSICQSIGLREVERIEYSTRYLLFTESCIDHSQKELEKQIADCLHDKMTEMQYEEPIESFDLKIKPKLWHEVDVMTNGRAALESVAQELGLSFDDWDFNFYTEMFRNKLKRNPTSVECFDLAQSNSEHSRHWFFKGKLVVDGKVIDQSLFDLVIATQKHSNPNNVIKFSDNSSAIEGFECDILKPKTPSTCCYFETEKSKKHIIFTAETHNFPTGVAPFPGATTGTGGRIRDVQAVGRGGHVVAGTAGYSFGNLLVPGYDLDWEDKTFSYPSNLAKPVDIIVQASNGASDYGNKFGEPLIAGFARSFGMKLPNGERREWNKPIMFSGGIGSIDHDQIKKDQPEKGMEVVKIGGPIYRIGVGGGSASSMVVHGDNKEELDYGAVQRGDAEMEQKLNRVIRACLGLGSDNPIASIHDQGAGGNGNVLKELSEPAGAVIYTGEFQMGDPTISTLECWGAEYQESNAVLIRRKDKNVLENICMREKCPVSFVGEITGDGKVILVEGKREDSPKVGNGVVHPVNLDLECVLGKMPQKTFNLNREKPILVPLSIENVSVYDALGRVLRLPSVGSKRYLTNKVDRSVTGLVAQQQCVGPLHTPLADVAVIAQTYFNTTGAATSIGEQPIKGLVDPAVGARMSVAEAMTNLMFALVSSLQDVKCSGNWMWAAKLAGEGAALYDACKAMSEIMSELGIAVDGGKDSLSMAARIDGENVKSPGTLVVSAYAPCPDITKTVTPDFKCPKGKSVILYVKIEKNKFRVGGTALAQVFNQLGNESPDIEHPQLLKKGFEATQQLIREQKLLAGHDVSDGGFITALLEMSFAGNCGFNVNIKHIVNRYSIADFLEILFNEEVGWILEVEETNADYVVNQYQNVGVSCEMIGYTTTNPTICIAVNEKSVLSEQMAVLRNIWEETSFRLELLQTARECVRMEEGGMAARKNPPFVLSFDPNESILSNSMHLSDAIKVAVVREEGTNGDLEMVAALNTVGFQVWDVTMTDLAKRKVTLDHFQGLIFPGGFSYADVLGSARGWAASFLFDKELYGQFETFKNRQNTFTLGVCNGCQLSAILGLVGPCDKDRHHSSGGTSYNITSQSISLDRNSSGRFESRFSTVQIQKSPAIMFKGMEGSILGVWVAHGEGKFLFKKDRTYELIRSRRLAPLIFVDDDANPTTVYPFNPNGSIGGLAGLCSEDGRHLAVMPHPERCCAKWQWPWMPLEWKERYVRSPWLRMFENAYSWAYSCTTPSS
ncbi:hypothetical protein CHUAL_011298 [Chamberlinius hualienensis]